MRAWEVCLKGLGNPAKTGLESRVSLFIAAGLLLKLLDGAARLSLAAVKELRS